MIANAEEKIHTAIYFTNLFENVDSIVDGGQIIINERKAFLGIGYKHTYSHAWSLADIFTNSTTNNKCMDQYQHKKLGQDR